MTCIIGIEDPERRRALLFSDSGAWRGDSRTSTSEPKIWRDGDWIVGTAGKLLGQQIVRDTPLPALEPGTECRATLSAWAITVQRKLAEIYQLLRSADPEDKGDAPTIIVAHGSSVWDIQGCAIGGTTDGFRVAGARDFGMAAMYGLSMVASLSPFECASLTMKAAAEKTDWCVGTIRWLATDGTEGIL